MNFYETAPCSSLTSEVTMDFGWVRSCLMCTLRVVLEDWLFVSSDIVAPISFGKGVMSC